MDAFQSVFRDKTVDEVSAWTDKYLSEVNGRPLHGASGNEADIARWDALTDAEKAEMDAISGATISLTDAHGDMLSALSAFGETARSFVITIEQKNDTFFTLPLLYFAVMAGAE